MLLLELEMGIFHEDLSLLPPSLHAYTDGVKDNQGTAAYQLEITSSCMIAEIKQHYTRLVLGWETVQALSDFCCQPESTCGGRLLNPCPEGACYDMRVRMSLLVLRGSYPGVCIEIDIPFVVKMKWLVDNID